MATALTAQLDHIRTRSLNPLNPKVLIRNHAQSLLFDEQAAASQDFETIHQICYEGFQELCQLDSSFSVYDGNIFGEQSKFQDRTQWNAAKAGELNITLEHLLGLLGDKLLLRSALKVLEWLVRRFRVHEYNTTYFAFIFLPYHGNPIFTTMLSILPRDLPRHLQFLLPYVHSSANPSRQTLVHVASYDRIFLPAFTRMVFGIHGKGIRYPALSSLWGSVAIETLAQMLNDCQSASSESQYQKHENILRLFLPMINDGLLTQDSQELRIGCYMILVVLVSKVDLQSKVMSAVMQAVVVGWEQSSHAGLICLAVLAQRSYTKILPRKVVKALSSLPTLYSDLLTLQKSYSLEHLVLGMVLGLLNQSRKTRLMQNTTLIRKVLEAGFLHESSLVDVLAMVRSSLHAMGVEGKSLHLRQQLNDILLRISHAQQDSKIVRQSSVELQEERPLLEDRRLFSKVEGLTAIDFKQVKTADVDVQYTRSHLVDISSQYADDIDHFTSFLSHAKTSLFDELEKLFCSIHSSAATLSALLQWPVLKRKEAMTEPLFLSFFIRLWCGHSPPDVRAAALCTVAEHLDRCTLTSNVQILLPYILHALADLSYQVRQAAARLVLALSKACTRVSATNEPKAMWSTSGMGLFYGQSATSTDVSWLTYTDVTIFVDTILVPRLEECLLDEQCCARILITCINGSTGSDEKPDIRRLHTTSFRTALFTFVCCHVVAAPLFSFKLRLLRMVNQVERVSGTTRTKLLLPLESAIAAFEHTTLESICRESRINTADFLYQISSIFTHSDREGILRLKHAIEDTSLRRSQMLQALLFRRIAAIWPDMRADFQMILLRSLLRAAIGKPLQAKDAQGAATLTLKSIRLPTSSLQAFLSELPRLAASSRNASSATKRRRISPSQISAEEMPSGDGSYQAIQEYAVVLDLITTSGAEKHPELLASLFQVARDLRLTGLTYLQVSALENILTILSKAKIIINTSIDTLGIRGDIIVEYIKITCSPQVRNTALLVASALAELAPDQMLHLIMPIFAYMGANVLRQEDEYSVQIVDRVMDRIIPRLVDASSNNRSTTFTCIIELIHNFAGAFEHIPIHRQLTLFVSLIGKIGPLKYLSVLIAILMVKYPNNQQVIQFCSQLTCEFDAVIQLRAFEGYVKIILDAQTPEQATMNGLIFGGHSEDPLKMIICLLPFIHATAQSDKLLSETASILKGPNTAPAKAVRESFTQIFQDLLLLIKAPIATPKVATLFLDALNATFGMIPIPHFLESLKDLLDRIDDDLRLYVLRSFERRIGLQVCDDRASRASCVAFIPCLTRMIEGSTDSSLKRSAVSTIDQVIEKYGKICVAEVLKAATVISGDQCLGPTSQASVRAASLLCLSTMIEVASDTIVPLVPTAFSRAIESLNACMDTETKDRNLHDAAYSVIQALLLYVPWMMTGTDLDLILISLHRSANVHTELLSDVPRVETARTFSRQVNANECLLAIQRTWTSALREGPKASSEHIAILRLSIDHMPRRMVVSQTAKLTDILIDIFDLRHYCCWSCEKKPFDIPAIDEIEAETNEAAIAMIYKLNDATLKPMFARLIGHAAVTQGPSNGNIYRHITLYTFLLNFFGTFKSIVTSYAGYVIVDTVHVFQHTDPTSEGSMQLWRIALQTLRVAFEHDQDDFYRENSALKAIMTALTSQFTLANRVSMIDDVIPTVVELAVASGSLCQYKALNSMILPFLRSEDVSIRLSAVLCERALTDRMGEDWLAMLPEMLPVIAELQEDDNDKIEEETLRWVQKIEAVLGENIHSMLK